MEGTQKYTGTGSCAVRQDIADRGKIKRCMRIREQKFMQLQIQCVSRMYSGTTRSHERHKHRRRHRQRYRHKQKHTWIAVDAYIHRGTKNTETRTHALKFYRKTQNTQAHKHTVTQTHKHSSQTDNIQRHITPMLLCIVMVMYLH